MILLWFLLKADSQKSTLKKHRGSKKKTGKPSLRGSPPQFSKENTARFHTISQENAQPGCSRRAWDKPAPVPNELEHQIMSFPAWFIRLVRRAQVPKARRQELAAPLLQIHVQRPVKAAQQLADASATGEKNGLEPSEVGELSNIQWMDRILHHVEIMGNHCLLAFTGESSFQGCFLGGVHPQ